MHRMSCICGSPHTSACVQIQVALFAGIFELELKPILPKLVLSGKQLDNNTV